MRRRAQELLELAVPPDPDLRAVGCSGVGAGAGAAGGRPEPRRRSREDGARAGSAAAPQASDETGCSERQSLTMADSFPGDAGVYTGGGLCFNAPASP